MIPTFPIIYSVLSVHTIKNKATFGVSGCPGTISLSIYLDLFCQTLCTILRLVHLFLGLWSRSRCLDQCANVSFRSHLGLGHLRSFPRPVFSQIVQSIQASLLMVTLMCIEFYGRCKPITNHISTLTANERQKIIFLLQSLQRVF